MMRPWKFWYGLPLDVKILWIDLPAGLASSSTFGFSATAATVFVMGVAVVDVGSFRTVAM
jgi:hypothetical protein